MAYDTNKDKVLAFWEMETNNDFFTISIFSYNGGQPKLQLGRYFSKNGEIKFSKLGRMSIDETKFLNEKLPEILQKMSDNV